MPIAFACTCGKTFKVADEQAGKKTKCPACAAPLVVPDATVEDDFDVVDDEPAVAANPAKASKVVVVESDDDDAPKKKKKKKKSGGISKADWKAEEAAPIAFHRD